MTPCCQHKSRHHQTTDHQLNNTYIIEAKPRQQHQWRQQRPIAAAGARNGNKELLLRELGLCKVLNRKLPDNWDECLPKLTEEDNGKAGTTQDDEHPPGLRI